MATITRDVALAALKKADCFGLWWGRRLDDGTDTWCAAAWALIWAHGPGIFELREDLWFPRTQHLTEAIDALAQVANWAETFGYISRNRFDETIVDVYVFRQEVATQKARDHNS